MANYLVTGGAGFIGSHLVDSLTADGHAVLVLDDLSTGCRHRVNPSARLIVDDINQVARHVDTIGGLDGCFHLAAVASVQRANEAWSKTHDVNARGTIAVFEAARDHGFPVVYASSAAVYGDPDRLPISEDTAPNPLSAYGADKLAGEHQARVAGLVHGVPTYGLRFFNVYGPRQNPRSPYSGVVSVFVDRLSRDQPVVIHGDGLQSRDFVAVPDVIRGLRAALERVDVRAPISNLCAGRAVSVLDLAHILGEVVGTPPRLSFATGRAGDVRHSMGDTTRMRTDLGLTASTGLHQGLEALVAWAERNGRSDPQDTVNA